MLRRIAVVVAVVAVLGGASVTGHAQADVPYGATARPGSCQPGDQPETGLQGEVTQADRTSGRSASGYSCNLSLVGGSQGQGSSWVSSTYDHCAYVAQSLVGNLLGTERGVRVLDVSDPSAPVLTAHLTSPAMAGDTWESLRVNTRRGLLAAVAVGPAFGVAFFDVYDIGTDCAHPRLLNSVAGTDLSIPANVIGHEGGFSPDGLTYWASGVVAGSITAIDLTDPSSPRLEWTGVTGTGGHGFDISPDGNRMYLTSLSGFTTFDISQVQSRAAVPVVTPLGSAKWPGTVAPQHTISVTYRGAPWIIAVDEIGRDGIHFVDNTDPAAPIVHPGISLEIERPEHADLVAAEAGSDALGLFGYGPHYCSVDRIVEPTALACGYFQSGIRVFDIRDLAAPREIAYFNPPARTAQKGELAGSWHSSLGDLTADWCTSPPAFVDGRLWVTCQDNGFMVLSFAAGTYPLPALPVVPEVPVPSTAPTVTAATAATVPSSSGGATRAAALPATGGAGTWVLVGAALLGVALLSRALVADSRGSHRGGSTWFVLVVLVAAAAGLGAGDLSSGPSSRGPGARFAAAMIEHHEEAIAMARAAELDPRTTPTNRALAVQIEAQQTAEVALLDGWLRGQGEPGPDPAAHAAHAAALVAGQPQEGAAAFNATFLATMAAHHRTAIPLATAAARDAEPAVARLASAMLVDQTVEAVAIDRLRGAAAGTEAAPGAIPYICDLTDGRPV